MAICLGGTQNELVVLDTIRYAIGICDLIPTGVRGRIAQSGGQVRSP